MSLDIQFLDKDDERTRIYKLRQLVEEVVRLARSRGSSGGGGDTVLDAQYLLIGASSALPASHVLSVTGGLQLALTPGVATLSISNVPIVKIGPIASGVLLGRYTPGTGEAQIIGVGTGLELTDGGVLQLASTAVNADYPAVLGHAGI